MNVTDTTVILSWSPPNELGTPSFNYYRILMVPAPPTDVILNTTNTTLSIDGIIPGTTYNVTIVAVIVDNNFGILEGQQSLPISFVTMQGRKLYILLNYITCHCIAPMFDTISVNSVNGNIYVSWTFRHTGGQDIDVVQVICNTENDHRLSRELSCDMMECVNNNLMGTASIGPVLAGETYTCNVTAVNHNGTDVRNFTVIPTQGISTISYEVAF